MIEVEHLSKYFGPVLAVNNVSFQVEKNEIVGLLGNNGAGKTTIMRILTTYLPASSGIARVDGFDVMTQSMDVRRRVGYLPESIPLYTEMRVTEYLAYRAKLKGVERASRNSRIGSGGRQHRGLAFIWQVFWTCRSAAWLRACRPRPGRAATSGPRSLGCVWARPCGGHDCSRRSGLDRHNACPRRDRGIAARRDTE